MSNQRRSLAELLSHNVSHEYSVKHYGIVRVIRETFASPEQLGKILEEEQARMKKFREDLASAISPSVRDQALKARVLINFLKIRMNRLEFWSGFLTALTAISGVALAVQGLSAGVSKDWVLSLTLLTLTLLFACLKWRFEKHKYWYGYLIAHAESIEFQVNNVGKERS
jgi:hypothetical protein|tara:strand:+ start:346 stop:852 length:507 start_codon:yes stop_codon:yes gene_type:complete